MSPFDPAVIAAEAVARAGADPDSKRPLFRNVPPAPPFPMHALGELQKPAEAIEMRTQAPKAICAQSVLAAATLAVQAHRDVELPGGRRRPLSGMFVSVGESGERKTSVDEIALAPIYAIEEQWAQDRKSDLADYINDNDAWKAAREAAKGGKKNKDRDAIRSELDAIGPAPRAPPKPTLLVVDFSPEGLMLHLRESRPSCGVFTPEGGMLVGGHAFAEDKAMATGSLLNSLWDGSPIRRTRVLTGDTFLSGRRCSAHIMMQAVVANKLLGDSVLNGIGTIGRLLIVEPESTIGHRPFREAPPQCADVLLIYSRRLMYLLTRKPVTVPDCPDMLNPPIMKLAPQACALWVAFHDEVERGLQSGGDLHPIRSFGAKLAEHAGRLAAVLAVYKNSEASEVSGEAMTCGITLAKHYAAEMQRLQGASVPHDLHLADRLLAWWRDRPDARCHLAAIYQLGPFQLRDAATARRIVGILEEHGWVRRLPAGTMVDSAPRREAWILVA